MYLSKTISMDVPLVLILYHKTTNLKLEYLVFNWCLNFHFVAILFHFNLVFNLIHLMCAVKFKCQNLLIRN